MRPKILLIDDDAQLSDVLSLSLETSGYDVKVASCAVDAIRLFQAIEEVSLVLLDLRLGEDDGIEVLHSLRSRDPDVPILMITAHGDVDSAVDAFRGGVNGYLKKPFNHAALLEQVADVIESRQRERDARLRLLERDAARATGDVRKIILSRDSAMDELIRKVATAAQVSSSVVVTGESGTGKELVARALHECGPRRVQPFVAFNCAALPETLLESELFGHARGAYTDAKEAKPGLFVRADKGTLFLDEIGDAPVSIQAKLLRVLQEREVLPLGAKTPIKIDVRIIAATHRSLAQEVEDGRFRRDLFYRLHVLPIQTVPLRERKRDIAYLASCFAVRLAEHLKVAFDGFSTQAYDALLRHDWPGNVRELQNRVEHALAIGKGGLVSAKDLFPEHFAFQAPIEEPAPNGALVPFKEAKNSFEREYVLRLLSEAQGSVTRAAKLAEKSRAEVYALLRKHAIDLGSLKRN